MFTKSIGMLRQPVCQLTCHLTDESILHCHLSKMGNDTEMVFLYDRIQLFCFSKLTQLIVLQNKIYFCWSWKFILRNSAIRIQLIWSHILKHDNYLNRHTPTWGSAICRIKSWTVAKSIWRSAVVHSICQIGHSGSRVFQQIAPHHSDVISLIRFVGYHCPSSTNFQDDSRLQTTNTLHPVKNEKLCFVG